MFSSAFPLSLELFEFKFSNNNLYSEIINFLGGLNNDVLGIVLPIILNIAGKKYI